jgi:hypothetical protein
MSPTAWSSGYGTPRNAIQSPAGIGLKGGRPARAPSPRRPRPPASPLLISDRLLLLSPTIMRTGRPAGRPPGWTARGSLERRDAERMRGCTAPRVGRGCPVFLRAANGSPGRSRRHRPTLCLFSMSLAGPDTHSVPPGHWHPHCSGMECRAPRLRLLWFRGQRPVGNTTPPGRGREPP